MNSFFKKHSPDLKDYTLYFLLFVMLVIFTRPAALQGDLNFWKSWSLFLFEHGLPNVYQNGSNNYNPLFHYFILIYTTLANNAVNIVNYLSLYKIFPLIFDFAGALVAVSLVKEKDRRFFLSLLLLFNVGYLYNSVIWVQVDAIFTCLTFIAVVLALRQKPVLSMLFFVLALNAKTQAIIFLPALLLLWVPLWFRSVKSLGISVVAAAVLQVLILAPFIWFGKENDLDRIININFNAVDFYPFVSMNAYNIWFFLIDKRWLMEVSDAITYAGITYKHWGLLMFFFSSAIVLFPLLLLTLRKLATRQVFSRPDYQLVLLSCALIPICFCYFNTQMHERYWHAAILFLAAYAFLSRNYGIYIIASIAYFLNLEKVMKYLSMRNYSILFFDPRFVAGLFSIVLVWGIWQLYARAEIKDWLMALRPGNKAEVSEAVTV